MKDALNGLPLWAKTAASLSTTSAVIVLLFYLVYSFMVERTAANTESRRERDTLTIMLSRHVNENQQKLDEILSILQQICLNVATNDEARRRCVAHWR